MTRFDRITVNNMLTGRAGERALRAVKDYPLSDADIRNLLGRNIKIWVYPQLKTLSSIDDLFDDQGRAILLFPTESKTSGHWTALIRHPSYIEFFDPYGDGPDDGQSDGMSEERVRALEVDRPYLTRLLRESGLPVYYNHHAFQRTSPDVNTCGRHCVTRLYFSKLSLDDYTKVLTSSKLTPDDFVSGVVFSKIRR